ncbi:MAG: T9SS type A sorting domain-containing protein [Ignavibacteria bacterium]|jgi:photosystem II stability/assembly factor-like uncharacterized protein
MKKIFFSLPIALFALILFLQSSITSDGPLTWTQLYNNLGRIYLIVVTPPNQNTIYEAGLDSGVYKSTNAGLNWIQVNTGMTYIHVQALAVSPSNPSVIYAGTDQLGTTNSGVYKSTNAGASWTLMNSGIVETSVGIQTIVVHPTDPNTAWMTVFDGLVNSTNGVYKTTNGGTNWFAANGGMTIVNVLSLIINPLNPNVLYAGTSYNPSAITPTKIYKTYNGGTNWIEISNGLPTGTTTGDPVRCLSISTVDTARVLAGLFMNDTLGGAYLTTNGGTLWVKKQNGLGTVAGTLIRNCLIRPGSSTEFYVGLDGGGTTARGVFRTTDAGNTWVDFNNGDLVNTFTVRGLAFKTLGDSTLYAGCSAIGFGVFGYSWPAPTPIGWSEQTSPVTTGLNTVSAVSNQIGWIGGNSGVVLRTTNGGSSWTNVTGAPIGTDAVYAICGIDANTCLVSTSPSNTFVFKTTNGGANWTQVFTVVGGFVDDIKMFSATNGYLYGDPVGGRWELYKTTNAGTNWDSTGLYLPQAASEAGWNNAMCIRGTKVWFGTNNTKVYYSTNSGTNWTAQATTGSVNTYSVSFDGAGNIGMCGESAALRSTNSGVNWTVVTVPGTGSIIGFGNALQKFWYARANIIYQSTDNGATFALQYTSPSSGSYNGTSFVMTGNVIRGWAVTSSGTISIYNEILTGIANNNNQVPKNFSLGQNYPNPFNPTTKIAYQLPKAELVKLTVYDLLGREVSVLVNEYKQAGSYTIDFNASNYASGVYFYRIEAGDFKDVKRMVLVK